VNIIVEDFYLAFLFSHAFTFLTFKKFQVRHFITSMRPWSIHLCLDGTDVSYECILPELR